MSKVKEFRVEILCKVDRWEYSKVIPGRGEKYIIARPLYIKKKRGGQELYIDFLSGEINMANRQGEKSKSRPFSIGGRTFNHDSVSSTVQIR